MTLILDNEVRQEQVAQAALAVVAEHGIRRLRLASVARAGVTPSALYRRFDSQDATIDTVVDLVRARLLASVRAVTLARSEPLEQWRPLLASYVHFIKKHPALPRIIVSEQGYEGRRGRRRAMFRTIWRTLARPLFFASDVNGHSRSTVRFATIGPSGAACVDHLHNVEALCRARRSRCLGGRRPEARGPAVRRR